MQVSRVVLVAVRSGIVLERSETPFLSIIGNARIMGAFIIAITAFLHILKDRFLSSGAGEIA